MAKNLITRKDIGLKGPLNEGKGQKLKPDEEVRSWLEKLDSARKLEKEFRKEGQRVTALYEGAKKKTHQYNILYSNTETMLPALYNSTPRPVVQRRFKDADALGKMSAQAGERILAYLIDDGNAKYTTFDEVMKSATTEALVPGRGISRFKYDASFKKTHKPKIEGEQLAEGDDGMMDQVDYETVCCEEVPWDRFLHGPAKKWKDVPWISFEHFMVREELVDNFGKEVGEEIPVTEMLQATAESDDPDTKNLHEDVVGLKVARVFEIWNKATKEVIFVCEQWPQGIPKKVPDPLKLEGFYPCPRPLTFMSKISTILPVALYTMYEEQAEELNKVTFRINLLIAALKVRGMYDATLEGLKELLEADDNVLIPVENVAALLAQGNPLEKGVWFMPLQEITTTLQQLYVQRQQVKDVIFEITGIADIMRGSSQASETLGAQQLKNQWGTLRLKKSQKEVMRYARDCLRILLEIAVTKLAPETLQKMTGLPYPTGPQKKEAEQKLGMLKQQAEQQLVMSGQVPPGQPINPQQLPPPPPELMKTVQSPSWDDLLMLLRDDIQRNYRIDIQTNSTVDAEATEDKEDIAELLNAISQFLNGVAPLVENGSMPFEAAQGMLLAVIRRFRFGPELEDQLMLMKPPQPKVDPKQQAEMQKAQDDLKQQKEQLNQGIAAAKEKGMAAQMDLDYQKKQWELQKKMDLQEVANAKKLAQQELDNSHKLHSQELANASSFNEDKLAQKVGAHGEKVAKDRKELDGKGKELATQAQKMSPDAIIKPILDEIAAKFAELQATIQQAAQTRKRAVKQKDGSWATEVMAH